MRALLSRRVGLAALIAGAVALAAAGIAYASIPDATGVIHGCYNPNGAKGMNGTGLNIIDTASASCGKSMQPISWNQKGPTGGVGPPGAKGTTGTTGAAGPSGPTGAAGPSNAYTNYGDLTSIGEALTQTISSVTLPVGKYTLSAAVRVFPPAGGDATFVECQFVSFGSLNSQFMQTTTQADGLDNVTETTMPLVGDVTVTSNNTSVFLRCESFQDTADVQGGMIATQVGTITASG